jgi:hypothetical protein
MNQATRLIIFKAQTSNVREIDKDLVQINRVVNDALRHGNDTTVHALTKPMALVFCAWVEANFSKVIHTPYGFSLNEIQQIKKVYKENGLERGWEKCIELGIRRIAGRKNSNYTPNIRQELKKLVSQYVVEPRLLRNKVAHGQWVIALNTENNAVNNDLTNALNALNVVTISRWFKINEHLALIVEALIESPNRAFHRDYILEITKLKEFILKSEDWSMEQKISLLRKKPVYRIEPELKQ